MVAAHRKYAAAGGGFPPAVKVVVVGYALTSKKIKSFLQPKFERLARNKGIRFVAIDQSRPLSDQGPFDIVLHKLSGKEWRRVLEVVSSFISLFILNRGNGFDMLKRQIRLLRQLQTAGMIGHPFCLEFLLTRDNCTAEICFFDPLDALLENGVILIWPGEFLRSSSHHCFNFFLKDYRNAHPEVTVLDPPDAIQQVHNRQSMLQDVADLNLSDPYGKVGVPKQLVIKKDPSAIPGAVNKAGLRLPIVAKPLVAKSHELSLAYDEVSLQNLEPPLVLQEFINHGGVLFKVYIVGEAIKVVRRFSLPDVSKRELSKNAGVYRFPRVSCAAASADEADLDPCVAELPPRPLLERLARELRRRLGLRLFNLDIIREHGTQDHYYVIDINYFPGYGKLPEYEHIFTDFLLSLGQSK
ncbi:UNVERIFIED_CONTAM: Inositol-tetrakisphosphate 1-kinase [Sesamum latifolium]|uniref:Inositol-tetrakisphosphate 1-kinase n=1 Tax=Sesamum latifolium TaxID=2727402 RepID=A0AAW2VTM6_9LAMI